MSFMRIINSISLACLLLAGAGVAAQETGDRVNSPQRNGSPGPATPTKPASPPPSPLQSPSDNNQAPVIVDDLSRVPLLQWEPRPVAPPPTVTRVGVSGDHKIALSMNDAIRRALENNQNIEVARDNVQIIESNLRVLEGVYDPVLQLTPLLNQTVTPTTSTLAGTNGIVTGPNTVKQTDLLVTPSLTKLFSSGGGQYQVFFNGLRRSIDSPYTLLSPLYSSNFGATFVQPLMRNRAVDQSRHNIRIQRKRLSQSDAEFRQQTINIIAQVQQAYWELVFALRDQQNRLETVNLAREQLRQIEARISAGLSSPLERAEAATQIESSKTNLLAATQYVTVTENALKQLLLPDGDTAEWSAEIVPVDQPNLDLAPVNLTDALKEGRTNRPELSLLRTQQEINEIDRDFYHNQTLPRIDLQATAAVTGLAGNLSNPAGALASGPVVSSATGLTVGAGAIQLPQTVTLNQLTVPGIGSNIGVVTLPGASIINTSNLGSLTTTGSALNANPTQGSGTSTGTGNNSGGNTGGGQVTGPSTGAGTVTPTAFTIPPTVIGGFSQQLRNLLSFNTRSAVVGVTIELPLRNRSARANLAGANLQRQQLIALLHATDETIQAEVRNAAQTVDTTRQQVLSSRAARESAEVQLAGERKLYQTGLSTTFLVFQRENQLTAARGTELRAETDYNKALALLQRATSTTLRANNVSVETVIGK